MTSTDILNALEKEKGLLEDFICLSEEQLLLLADEDLDGFDTLLLRRADLMMELTALEEALASWIFQLRNDPTVPSAMMQEIRSRHWDAADAGVAG